MSRTSSDRYQRQVVELVKQPGNSQCADCKQPNPRWASWDQGVFLCVKCASMHRKIGSHISKVKSLTLDTWTRDQVDNMRKLGNVKVNSLLNPDERRNPPPPPDSDGDSRNSDLERFVRNKYEYKVFQDFDHAPPSLPLPARQVPPVAHPGISSRSSVPPPPVRTTVYSPPPGPPPPPPPPSSSSSIPLRTNPAPAPALPARAVAPSPARIVKSVRFPSDPPIQIPSPPDSDLEDDDGDNAGSNSRRAQSRHRTLARSSTRSILVRRASNAVIPIDWAAITRDADAANNNDDDGEEDVPLQALGALGIKGANVGLVGVPTSYYQPGVYTPMAMYGAPSPGGGGGGGGVKPLMPQFTGSAKGYLHQMHAGTFQGPTPTAAHGQPPAMLVPQMTGSVSKSYGSHGGGGGGAVDGDSFMRMFQPPTTTANDFQQQPPSGPHSNQFQPQQFQPPPQSQRTNPFTRFASAPGPPQHPAPATQPPVPQASASASVWDDLVSLSPSPSSTPQPQVQPLRPQLTGFVPSSSFGQQLARESSPSPAPPPLARSNSPFQSQQQQQQPSPLKPQYTGFVPSSSFGQSLQLSHPNSDPSDGLAPPPPRPLQPQRTGFVPSSSFGQQLAKDLSGAGGGGGGGASSSSSAGLFDHLDPAPPLSAPVEDNARRASPGLFDFDLFPGGAGSNGASQPQQQSQTQPQPQPQRNASPNPFLHFPTSLASALPNSGPNPGPTSSPSSSSTSTNPFFSTRPPPLQQQQTGWPAANGFFHPPPASSSSKFRPSPSLHPQVTGYLHPLADSRPPPPPPTNPFSTMMVGGNGMMYGTGPGHAGGGGGGGGYR
ncbi:hypothetical protein JCM11491_005050 [Sporobolomyces phaffii]